MDNCGNYQSITSLCSALCEIIGVKPPKTAKEPNKLLTDYANRIFEGKKADRILMYNPDAIAEWIYRKYPLTFEEVTERCELEVPLKTVMPSVTPVCFASMYTGAFPEVHGIKTYTKPVITAETVFDTLINSGKKPVIVAQTNSSISRIFLERNMDYFIYETIEEVNAKTAEIIIEDNYDFIVVYNDNYDSLMHRYGPESTNALEEAKVNTQYFAFFDALIRMNLNNHRWLLGFAMDHGAHEIDAGCGSHGLDMPEDIDIVHLYKAYNGKL